MIDSNIEWTNHTANLWWGCVKVQKGCDHCYAELIAYRVGNNVWGNDKPRRQIASFWSDLKKYQNNAQKANAVHKVFVGSMMDIFEKPMPLIDNQGNEIPGTTGDLRQTFFENISKGMYPNLIFLLLTKRPSNINKYIPKPWLENPPKNVMFGTSICDQATAVTYIGQLMQVKGSKFLSVEPQLDEITLLPWLEKGQLDWIIQGGESGPRKRPFNLAWARKMKGECKATNTPYFFKQIDKVKQIPEDLYIREYPETINNYKPVSKCGGCCRAKREVTKGFIL